MGGRTTHGENSRNSRLYRIWAGMKQRCQNPRGSSFKNYGERGIRVCDDWQRYEPFRNWALVNGYSATLTLDRVDFNGHYAPSNCRWLPLAEQPRNSRRCKLNMASADAIRAEYSAGGVIMEELAAKYGCSQPTIAHVLRGHTWVK